MKYKVSIIIPVYKVEKYLRKALDSVVNQTLKDIEIICINDCSPDNSAEILNEYASKDKRFIIINQETNQGQGVARNIGIEKATGKYIMFLDPDDWFELNACETAYNAAEKYSANAVYFPNYIVSEISGKEYTTNLIKEYSEKYNIEIKPYTFYNFLDLPHTTFRTFGMAPWRYMCLTEMIITNNVKFSDYRKGEDQPFSININLISKILYIDKPLYNYLERSDSSRIYETLYEENINSIKQIVEKFPENKKIQKLFDEHAAWRYSLKLKDVYNYNLPKFVCEHINALNISQWITLYKKFLIHNFIQQLIFSVRNEFHDTIKHKVITLLGIKIKIRVRQKL